MKPKEKHIIKADERDPEVWLERHGDYLLRYALLHTNSRALAEELVQEALISGIKAIDKFEGRSSVATWLRTILRNKIIDHARKYAKQRNSSYEELEFEERGNYFNQLGIWNRMLPQWGRDPETSLEDRGLYETIEDCLAKLPEKLRAVFTLREVDGLESEDICKTLAISSSNLYVILHRSRMLLRSCIEENWFERQ